MSRLPTVGGDNNTWGTVLNDFLDASYGFFRLSASSLAGATTINVDRLPGLISANAGHYIVVDPFTIEAELREVTGVNSKELTVGALTYAHAASDYVYFVTGTQGDLIPWSWWGGQARVNTDGGATQNTTAFNRLAGPDGEIYNVGRFGIGIDGTYYVNDELKPERSIAMIGETCLTSSILARSGFPFDASGDVAIIHPYRDGSPVLFQQAGPSGRWWFRNFEVDGQSLANSNGIISSPQQPDSTENIRVRNCTGQYGMSLNDVQYHDLRNIQFDNCATSLLCWSVQFMRVYNMNVTTPSGTIAVDLQGCTDSSFYGALLETVPTGGKIFSITGGSSRLGLYDVYTSGFSGGSTGDVFYIDSEANPSGKCTYIINNAHCAQNSATINMVNDVQRSISFDTNTDTDRSLVLGYAQDNMYQFVFGGGRIEMSGPIALPPFMTGPTLRSGSGDPDGVYTGPVGSLFMRTDGGAGTSLYVKETGTGNTGWVGK